MSNRSSSGKDSSTVARSGVQIDKPLKSNKFSSGRGIEEKSKSTSPGKNSNNAMMSGVQFVEPQKSTGCGVDEAKNKKPSSSRNSSDLVRAGEQSFDISKHGVILDGGS